MSVQSEQKEEYKMQEVTIRIVPPNQYRFIHLFDLKHVKYDEKTDTLFFRPGHIRYAKEKGIELWQKIPQASNYRWLKILK